MEFVPIVGSVYGHSPRGERGLKLRRGGPVVLRNASFPTRERGLKSVAVEFAVVDHISRSPRGSVDTVHSIVG